MIILTKHHKEPRLHTKVKSFNLFSSKFSFFLPVGISDSDTLFDPILSVNNVLSCRLDSILSFNIGGVAPNGAVFSMSIYPYSGGPATQTILSIRDSSTNAVSFVAEYSDTTSKITFYRKDSSGSLNAVATPSLTLAKSNFHFGLLN